MIFPYLTNHWKIWDRSKPPIVQALAQGLLEDSSLMKHHALQLCRAVLQAFCGLSMRGFRHKTWGFHGIYSQAQPGISKFWNETHGKMDCWVAYRTTNLWQNFTVICWEITLGVSVKMHEIYPMVISCQKMLINHQTRKNSRFLSVPNADSTS